MSRRPRGRSSTQHGRSCERGFLDYWSQLRFFFQSLSPAKQQLLINAGKFELAKVSSDVVRKAAIAQFNCISNNPRSACVPRSGSARTRQTQRTTTTTRRAESRRTIRPCQPSRPSPWRTSPARLRNPHSPSPPPSSPSQKGTKKKNKTASSGIAMVVRCAGGARDDFGYGRHIEYL
jgi:hypothetical protein